MAANITFNDINYGGGGCYTDTNWMSDYNRLINNTPTSSSNSDGTFIIPAYPFLENNYSGNIQQQQQFSVSQHQQQQMNQQQPTIISSSICGSNGEIAGSLPNMHSNILLQQQQNAQQRQILQMQKHQDQAIPCGSKTPTQQQQFHTVTCPQQQHQQIFVGQRLATPLLLCKSSQSAPTSPAQKIETNPLRQNCNAFPRTISTSPDSHEIPNIVLTGTDGSLDCFQDLQDLHLDNDLQKLLTNSIEQLDPALETQLLN